MTDRERRRNLMFSQNYAPEIVTTFSLHEEARGVYSPEQIEILYPVDPMTGYPRTDLGTLTDPKLTDFEREKVMQRLQRLDGSYLPKDLTDDEVFSLIPSRFFYNDPVDVQAWRDYLSEYVVPNMKDSESVLSELDESLPAGEHSVEPNNE